MKNKKEQEPCTCTDECLGYLTKTCRRIEEEPKQETIEEAIEQELENHFFSNISEIKQAEYFINFGAKWQQERMYSEEDMKKAFQDGKDNIDYSETYGWSSKLTTEEWFEQFKK
jgi:hypothetical protein